jgi:hypothetical protein
MTMPPNDSPVCLSLIYNQFDKRDILTLLVMILSDGSMTAIGRAAVKSDKE